MLEIKMLTLGPVQTNAYLVADTEQGEAVVIDPAWEGASIANTAQKSGWEIQAIWLTHAHFDHLGGVAELVDRVNEKGEPSFRIGLHDEDIVLWERKGGASSFGMDIDPGPRPNLSFQHGQQLRLGRYRFRVRFAPGHTPGHVMFYCDQEQVLFSGDVLFQGGIGRTDLPGGDHQTLLHSIRTQILPLPDETRVYSGHGPPTTVGRERKRNPFLV